MSTSLPDTGVPLPVRVSGALVTAQGAVAVVVAVILLVRGLGGADESISNGFVAAIWFGVLGCAVAAGGLALIKGQRWGRALAIVAQLLLLPVVWSLLTDSERPLLGSVLGVVVVTVLACLFSGPTTRWLATEYIDPAYMDTDDRPGSSRD